MTKIKKYWKPVFYIVTTITILIFWTAFFLPEESYDSVSYNSCRSGANVAVIKIRGGIVSYKQSDTDETETVADELIEKINNLKNNSGIKGVLLDIDSPGGDVAAGEGIMRSIQSLGVPVAATILSQGDSAAYLVASAADKIYAGELSEIGSISVSLSYLDYSESNKKNGIIYQEISSGKLKDVGVSERPLSTSEKGFLHEYVNGAGDILTEIIATNRSLTKEKVQLLSDGSVFTGRESVQNGLIDEIGGIKEATSWLEGVIGALVSTCFI